MEKKESKKKDPPSKGKRKSRNNQEFFGILFFLVMFYIALLGSMIKFLGKIILERKIEILEPFTVTIAGHIVLGLATMVSIYLIVIVIIGAYEISMHHKLSSKEEMNFRKSLREIVFGSAWILATTSVVLVIYLPMLYIYYFHIGYALTFMFLVVGFIFWTMVWPKMSENPLRILLRGDVKKLGKKVWRWLYIILGITVLVIVSFSLFAIGLYETSRYSITLDRELYFSGEDVYVNIFPEGLVKPSTINVTYSNENDALEYTSHGDFSKAPIYLKIPSEILKTEPYNSILQIEYELGTLDFIYRKNIKNFFIPVISGERSGNKSW